MNSAKYILLTVILWTVSFAAHAQNVTGVMMVVKGDIKVTSKDGATEAAKVGKKVSSGDTIVAGADSRAKIVMADKNVINVSPDSKIVIEKYENDGKDKKNVELNVLYGKVRASVEQRYDGEKNKFNVKTPSAVAGVRGTDFLTGYNPSTKTAQIITFSGSVAVGKPGPGGSIMNPVFVQPGQMTQAGAGAAPESPKAVPKEELNKMNSETKAESAGGAKNEPSANAAEAKKEEKKEDKAEEKKDASAEKSDKGAEKKEEKSAEKKDDKPAEKKEDKSAEKKEEKKADKGTEKSADKSADKPADKGSDKSADNKSADKGSDKGTEKKSADKGPDKSGGRAPASEGSDKSSSTSKSESGTKSPGPMGDSTIRQPASSGSLISAGDLPGGPMGTIMAPPPPLPGLPPMMMMPPPALPTVTAPTVPPDLIRTTQKSRVNINLAPQ